MIFIFNALSIKPVSRLSTERRIFAGIPIPEIDTPEVRSENEARVVAHKEFDSSAGEAPLDGQNAVRYLLPAENDPEPVVLGEGPFQFIQISYDPRTRVSIDQPAALTIDIIVANRSGEVVVALTGFDESRLWKDLRYRDSISGPAILCDKSQRAGRIGLKTFVI